MHRRWIQHECDGVVDVDLNRRLDVAKRWRQCACDRGVSSVSRGDVDLRVAAHLNGSGDRGNIRIGRRKGDWLWSGRAEVDRERQGAACWDAQACRADAGVVVFDGDLDAGMYEIERRPAVIV